MKNLLILIMLCCGGLIGAQSNADKLIFEWKNDDSVLRSEHPFAFENVSYWLDEAQLPVKEVMYSLPYFIHQDSIQVQMTFETDLVTEEEQLQFLSGIDKSHFHIVSKSVVCVRGKYFLQLVILPIVYDEFEHQFYKLLSLNYDVVLPAFDQGSQAKKQPKGLKSELSASVLSSGKWVKIKVSESGVHKIPYSQLTAWGFSDPSKVNVFGNGGNMLPRANSEFRHEDIVENAVLHENSAIYFYAQGPVGWHYNVYQDFFEHQLHDYTDVAYYFLSETAGVGKRVQVSDLISPTYGMETDEYDSYQFHELENQNLLKSGIEWYGLRFDPQQIRGYSFTFNNRVQSKAIKIKTNVIGRSDETSYYKTIYNGDTIQSISIPKVVYGNTTGAFANEGISLRSFIASGDVINLDLMYKSGSASASGWLNYITLNAKERIVVGKQLAFRNAEVVSEGATTRFYISGVGSNMLLWDVTDHTGALQIAMEDAGDRKSFNYKTDVLQEFVIFDKNAALPQPEFEETVDNQNIRGITVPEMLIVAHPLFESEAKRLASLHMQHSGLQCEVVYPYQIYNEFSSGSPDVSAIRDFARYLYNKDKKFKYLLLFGDGSYDNRTYDDKNTNFILTYQSDNSINVQYSYVSDDYFGCLDEGEGVNVLYDKMDIGIGRFPVSDIEEAKIMVDRIEHYLYSSEPGAWKTEITFVGDDGDKNLHMFQADQLSQQVYGDHPAFNHKKIYFDAYPKVTTSSGDRYPEVNEAIKEAIQGGTLIFNYTGHGSERQLAHENVLDITTIKSFTNMDRLPVFMTATCEFSRYDDYHDTSAGEWVVLSPLGGGVALFTTTRIAWSNSNFEINKNFYQNIFQKEESGNKLRLGEVIMNTKNRMGSTTNRLNFTLLGDPALQLIYPTGEIETHSINGIVEPSKRDTLKALIIATIEGELKNSTASESLITMQVFDKPITVKTLGNKGAVPFEYQVYQNRIYKGKQDARGNLFQTSFVVPKDIRYNVGNGRISYYSSSNDGQEAFGADNTVLVGAVSNNPPDDTQGPEIEVWLNDYSFVNGDVTGSHPVLLVNLSDESGINVSGVGIGHDITLVLDGNSASPINLNDYYEAQKNSFTKGTITYQLSNLEEGAHSLQLKAWDNLNNSSVATLDFEVHISGTLKMANTSVYPNPYELGSPLNIYFEHDAPNMLLDVTCRIYSLSGQLIEHYQTQIAAEGTAVKPIEWKPSILQPGLYLLNCEIRTPENQLGKFSKKILVIK